MAARRSFTLSCTPNVGSSLLFKERENFLSFIVRAYLHREKRKPVSSSSDDESTCATRCPTEIRKMESKAVVRHYLTLNYRPLPIARRMQRT